MKQKYIPVFQALFNASAEMPALLRPFIKEAFKQFDKKDTEALVYLTAGLLKSNFDRMVLAHIVGTSGATIEKWAKSDAIPKSHTYRMFAIKELEDCLNTAQPSPTVEDVRFANSATILKFPKR